MKIIVLISAILFFSPDGLAKRKKLKRKRPSKITTLLKSKDPRRFEKLTVFLTKRKYYFGAVAFAKEHLASFNEEHTELFDEAVEELIKKTGTDQFGLLSDELLAKSETPAIQFVRAKKAFERKQYNKALKHISLVPLRHRLRAESQIMAGSIWLDRKNFNRAIARYKSCIKSADFEGKVNKNEKVKRFYAVLREICMNNIARINYQNRKYDQATKLYRQIPKTSYIWPYTLLEQAWTAYQKGDFNRTLGALVAYKSPLMSSYFIPEAEVLQALAYFKMCLWNDSMIVVQNYHNRYAPAAADIRKMLQKHSMSRRYFYNLMVQDENAPDIKFVKGLITQIKKEIYYNLNLQLLLKVNYEIANLEKLKDSPVKTILLENAKDYQTRQYDILNYFVQRKMVAFINEINYFSRKMYDIHLENLSRMKEIIYDKKQIVENRLRGDLGNVNTTVNQYFWDFKGAFWADEIGDYVFGLKSNCNADESEGDDFEKFKKMRIKLGSYNGKKSVGKRSLH